MSTETTTITGLFDTESATLSAVREIQAQGWKVKEVHSPIPSDKLAAALNRKKSVIGWFTLTGGVTGFISGFSLAIFAATRWSLIVGGKPIVSWIPFFVIAFEFTILFAVLGNVAGLVTQIGIPAKMGANYHPDCSGSVYGVLAESTPEDAEKLRLLLQNKGATTP
ncbi:DUF3341 domain-containing protein [bacterium]|nr:DUF3341 domain-containing protein [bacterium]